MAAFTQPFTLQASTAGGPGPAATSNFITADFTNTTGQTVSQYVWGVSDGGVLGNGATYANRNFTGALTGSGFSSLTDPNLKPVLQSMAYPLYRFNSQCGYSERSYCDFDSNGNLIGGSCNTTLRHPLANEFSNLIANFTTSCPNARLIMGIGFGPDNWSSASAFASVCQQIAMYFNNNAPGLVYGWEIGNENNGFGSYNSYFNAGAVAIKAVNSNFKVFGPCFSYANGLVGPFAAGCASHCDVLDYHRYQYQFQSDFDNKGGQVGIETENLLSQVGSELGQYVSSGGAASTPVFIGEWNGNDTYGTLNGGQSPGVCNTFMQNGTGTVVGATTILSGLNASPNLTMAGIWSVWFDSDYGQIGGQDNVNGGSGYTPCPSGYFLGRAGTTLYGTRCNVSAGSFGAGTQQLAVKGGSSAGGFALMIVNLVTGGALNGQVALSHWPVNTSGTGTINYWQCGDTNPTPLTNTITVTAGLTQSISVPSNSVVILWSP